MRGPASQLRVPASQLAYLRCWRTLARAALRAAESGDPPPYSAGMCGFSTPLAHQMAGDVVFRLHQEPLHQPSDFGPCDGIFGEQGAARGFRTPRVSSNTARW